MNTPPIFRLGLQWSLVAVLLALSAACSVRLSDDFDSATFEETIRLSRQVDRFYGELLETAANKRPYKKYSQQYIDIETGLRALYVRNKVRPLNSESTGITQDILALWLKYKERHRLKDTYSDGNAKLERKRFTRMFIAALGAEEAKNKPSPQP